MSLYYLCPHCGSYQSIIEGQTCFMCKKNVTLKDIGKKSLRKTGKTKSAKRGKKC